MRTETDLWAAIKVGTEDECWPWLLGHNSSGYGKVFWFGERVLAHRVVAFLNGLIPCIKASRNHNFTHVRHTCDNPPCCNPRHFITGTQGDNQVDAIVRGRRTYQKGGAHACSKLSDQDISTILLYKDQPRIAHVLAKNYDVTPSRIYQIFKGSRHVGLV